MSTLTVARLQRYSRVGSGSYTPNRRSIPFHTRHFPDLAWLDRQIEDAHREADACKAAYLTHRDFGSRERAAAAHQRVVALVALRESALLSGHVAEVA